MSHDLSQPITIVSLDQRQRKRDTLLSEGPHSLGVLTLKITRIWGLNYLTLQKKFNYLENIKIRQNAQKNIVESVLEEPDWRNEELIPLVFRNRIYQLNVPN